MAKSPKCKFRKSAGRQCQANPMSDSQYCFFHDPSMAVKRTEARRSGGKKNKAAVLSAELPDPILKTVSDVASLLAVSINQVRKGELDPKIANCVGYLSSVLLKALEARTRRTHLSARAGSPESICDEAAF